MTTDVDPAGPTSGATTKPEPRLPKPGVVEVQDVDEVITTVLETVHVDVQEVAIIETEGTSEVIVAPLLPPPPPPVPPLPVPPGPPHANSNDTISSASRFKGFLQGPSSHFMHFPPTVASPPHALPTTQRSVPQQGRATTPLL